MDQLQIPFDQFIPFAVAVGIGLMLGADRERTAQQARRRFGVRTFPFFGLLGAISAAIGGLALPTTIAAGTLVILVWYRTVNAPQSDLGDDVPEADPGITTALAGLVTLLLGALAHTAPALAAAIGVVTLIMLSRKSQFQEFFTRTVTARDVDDALTVLIVTLLILPLIPDEALGPYGVLNPRKIWLLVVLLTLIGWAGYIATRTLGRRWGMLITGLAGGFVSGSASTAVMARNARTDPHAALPAAVAVNAATLAQAVLVTWILNVGIGQMLLTASLIAGAVIAAEVAVLQVLARRHRGEAAEPEPEPAPSPDAEEDEEESSFGRPMSPKVSIGLAVALTAMLLFTRWASETFGGAGAILVSAIGGLADAHAPAIAATTAVNAGVISPVTAALAIGAGLSTNLVVKLGLARLSGPPGFALKLAALLAPVAVATALGMWLGLALM